MYRNKLYEPNVINLVQAQPDMTSVIHTFMLTTIN